MARLFLAGAGAALLAGCTSDSSRFAENPFGGSDRMPTASTGANSSNTWLPPGDIAGGSVPAQVAGAAGSSIMSSPLPSSSVIQSSPLPPLASAGRAAASMPKPNFAAPSAASPRLAQASALASSPTVTGTARNLATSGNWSADGGTPIVAAQGESAEMLSARYGVPASALLAVNGLSSPSQIQPGTRLIVPIYNASRAVPKKGANAAPAAPVSTPVKAAAAPVPSSRPEKFRLVKGPEAAPKAPEKPAKVAAKPVVQAAKPASHVEKPVKAGEGPQKPAKVAEKPAVKPAKSTEPQVVQQTQPAQKPVKEKPAKVATTEKPVKPAKPEVQSEAPAAPAHVDTEPTGSVPAANESAAGGNKPEFRWPARGRIIQGFKKGSSDGINIAVPEGTPVKAAEAGVVAYAGSELKGYGNLVLIRHPNGYVSAYAHNGEINVKRGDQIRRGQPIATSGKSGNVSSPQVHFELRKGSTPVDPTEFLAGT